MVIRKRAESQFLEQSQTLVRVESQPWKSCQLAKLQSELFSLFGTPSMTEEAFVAFQGLCDGMKSHEKHAARQKEKELQGEKSLEWSCKPP